MNAIAATIATDSPTAHHFTRDDAMNSEGFLGRVGRNGVFWPFVFGPYATVFLVGFV
jgi:hypothetical protein